MPFNTGLTISAFNAVRFIVLEVTLGLFIPLLGQLYIQQRANQQILKGKGWTPCKGKQISWRLNFTTYSSLLLSMVALGIGLALEYGSGEMQVDITEKRTTDVWSTMLNRSAPSNVILLDRIDAEYSIYTSLASKFTRLSRENDTEGSEKKYIVHISPFYTTGLRQRMYPYDAEIREDPFVEFEAYSRNETEISVIFEEVDPHSFLDEFSIFMIKKDVPYPLAPHDFSRNFLVRNGNRTGICNTDSSPPLSASVSGDSTDVTCLYENNDHIFLTRGTIPEEYWYNFTEGFESLIFSYANAYKIQAPKQRSKTIDRIIILHYRDNSVNNNGVHFFMDNSWTIHNGGDLHVIRSIALLLHVGSFANETTEETVKVRSEIYASVEVWAMQLWVISTIAAIFISLVIWVIVRRSEVKVNVTRTDGMFLIADDMVSKSGDCNNPKRKTLNKVILVEKGSSVHLTIADPEMAVVYTDKKIMGAEC